MELDDFGEALEALVASGAANYGDGASIEELHHQFSRFESFVTEATAAFEAGEEWAADGAKTASAWIATRCRLPRRAARRRVRLGRALRQLPDVAEAWREGSIGPDQAQAIAAARRHRTESSMARDEAMLVAQAAEMGFEDFYRALSYWKQLADPDGADAAEEDRKNARTVFLEASLGGMWLGQMTLDSDSGLDRCERAQPTGARSLRGRLRRGQGERLGRTARLDELARTSAPAPGRRSRGDGHEERLHPGRGHPPRPALRGSSSAMRRCGAASVSSRTARCWPPVPWRRGWTRPTSSGPFLQPSATGSTSACGPACSVVGPAGPSS